MEEMAIHLIQCKVEAAEVSTEAAEVIGVQAGGGGSGYIGGVPSFKHTNGTTYSPSTTAGQKAGHGQAKITFVSF